MGFAIIQLLPIIFIHMALEKKNRKLKTALFVGALVVVFALLAIVMVQTSSQKNAINSRASEKGDPKCIAGCNSAGFDPSSKQTQQCIKTCKYDSKIKNCAKRCETKPVGAQKTACFNTCFFPGRK